MSLAINGRPTAGVRQCEHSIRIDCEYCDGRSLDFAARFRKSKGAMLILPLLSVGISQGRGSAEVHPTILHKVCTKTGCTTENGGIIIASDGAKFLKPNGDFDIPNICKRLLNGHTNSKASVRLAFLNSDGSIRSCVCLFDKDIRRDQVWKMVHKEIACDIDTSALGRGTNGALYVSEMDTDAAVSAEWGGRPRCAVSARRQIRWEQREPRPQIRELLRRMGRAGGECARDTNTGGEPVRRRHAAVCLRKRLPEVRHERGRE
jgi:hypothetical protein